MFPGVGAGMPSALGAQGDPSQATFFGTPIFPPNGGFAPPDFYSENTLRIFAEAGRKLRAMDAARNSPITPSPAAVPGASVPATQGAPAAPSPAGQQAAAFVVAIAQLFEAQKAAAKKPTLPPLPVLKTPEEVRTEAATETQNRALTETTELHGHTGGTQFETGGTGRSAPGSEAAVRGEIDKKTQAANWLSFGRKLGSSKDRLGWTVASIDALMQRIKKDPALLKRMGDAHEVRIGANVFSGPVAQLMLLAMTARPEERSLIRTIIGKTNSIHGKQRARILDILDPDSNPIGFRTNGFVATRSQIGVLQNWLDWENFYDREQGKRFGLGLGLALGGIGLAARARGVAGSSRGAAGSARRLRLLQNATTLARRGLGSAAAKQAAASLVTAQRLTRELIAKRAAQVVKPIQSIAQSTKRAKAELELSRFGRELQRRVADPRIPPSRLNVEEVFPEWQAFSKARKDNLQQVLSEISSRAAEQRGRQLAELIDPKFRWEPKFFNTETGQLIRTPEWVRRPLVSQVIEDVTRFLNRKTGGRIKIRRAKLVAGEIKTGKINLKRLAEQKQNDQILREQGVIDGAEYLYMKIGDIPKEVLIERFRFYLNSPKRLRSIAKRGVTVTDMEAIIAHLHSTRSRMPLALFLRKMMTVIGSGK